MAFEKVEPLAPDQAAEHYQGITDPAGQATPESVTSCGQSFELTTKAGRLVFTVTQKQDCLWIEGAAGNGADDMTAHGLAFIENMAKVAGLDSVGFQTARPGLARKAVKQGYTVAGWILKKVV